MGDEFRRSGADRREKFVDVDDERRGSFDRRMVQRDSNQIIEYMKKIPIFRGLSAEQYKSVLHICSKKLIPAEYYLCREGDKSSELFILLKGQLEVVTKSGAVLAYISSLGLIGEMGVFTDTVRSASVIATDDTMVIRISKKELFELFNTNNALGNRIMLNVIKDLAAKLREDNDIIEELRKRRSKIL